MEQSKYIDRRMKLHKCTDPEELRSVDPISILINNMKSKKFYTTIKKELQKPIDEVDLLKLYKGISSFLTHILIELDINPDINRESLELTIFTTDLYNLIISNSLDIPKYKFLFDVERRENE